MDADEICAIAFEAGRQMRNACQAIPERCGALVAVTSDQDECKQILAKEIRMILENLSDSLKKISSTEKGQKTDGRND